MTARPTTQPTRADAESFIEAIPNADRRADARALRSMLSEITREPAVLWGTGIVGFGTYHYRYESGHAGDAPLVSFAPRAAHAVVYLAGGYADTYPELLERLGPHKTGKSCLYLRRLGDVDLDVLRELVDRTVDAHRRADRRRGG